VVAVVGELTHPNFAQDVSFDEEKEFNSRKLALLDALCSTFPTINHPSNTCCAKMTGQLDTFNSHAFIRYQFTQIQNRV
jgi:hypothetical protein